MKTGILLVNLGTPEAPTTSAVKAYLGEFLMDPYVVDIPFLLRWLLVKGVILNTRPKRSARAYQQIWTDQGSPLLVHSLSFCDKLRRYLPEDVTLALGMRYGRPSIARAASELANCDRVKVLPCFPQYSLAATASAVEQARLELARYFSADQVSVVEDFFDREFYINAWVHLLREYHRPDHHLLFSYHGLPVKQLDKVASCRDRCSRQGHCLAVSDFNRQCYRAQCYASTAAIASALGLQREQYSVSFQSRLGKIPWIQPYTDDILVQLRQSGVNQLQVVCPSFVVDCLETLEEIGDRAKAQWLSLSGKSFGLIPCLNDRVDWVAAVAKFLRLL